MPTQPPPDPSRGAVLGLAPARPSLRVARNLANAPHLAQQTLVPKRLLRGLLPDALLDGYVFWQADGEPQHLHGFETDETAAAAVTHHRLLVELRPPPAEPLEGAVAAPMLPTGTSSSLFNLAGDAADGVVTRLPLCDVHAAAPRTDAVVDDSKPRLVLANAAASASSAPLVALLQRLESAAHTLFWCAPPAADGDAAALARVELPRLRLSFAVVGGRLLSEEHGGHWISDARGGALDQLLLGLAAHCLLLENATGEVLVLLPATGRPLPVASGVHLLHGDAGWLANLHPSVRHYVYAAHPSGAFLASTTLGSSLYLLVCYLFTSNHELAFRLAECCVSDTPLSPEEAQLWATLGLAAHDTHPDAHAVRLKLSLVTMGAEDVMACPWDVGAELRGYLSKAQHVSPACRLSPDEEALLYQEHKATLPTKGNDAVDVLNRRAVLKAIRAGEAEAPLALPKPLVPPSFDAVADGSCLDSGDGLGSLLEAAQRKGAAAFYSRAAEGTGAEVASIVHEALEGGALTLGGSRGFFFLYELMSGSLQLQLLPSELGDSPHSLACVLLRMLPQHETSSRGLLQSILRTMAANRAVAAALPPYEPPAQKSEVLTKEDPSKQLLLAVHDALQAKRASLLWATGEPMSGAMSMPPPAFRPPDVLRLQPTAAYRELIVPRATDVACAKLRVATVKGAAVEGADMDAAELTALCSTPLSPLPLDRFVRSAAARRDRPGGGLPFELRKHPRAKSPVALEMLSRLAADCELYADAEASRTMVQLDCLRPRSVQALFGPSARTAATKAASSLRALRSALEQLCVADEGAAHAAAEAALGLVNGVPRDPPSRELLSHRLRVTGGREPKVWFELLVALSMSEHGVAALCHFNPYLGEQLAQRALHLCAAAMLRTSRISQARRCLPQVDDLLGLVAAAEKAAGGAGWPSEEVRLEARTELGVKADGLASALAAGRKHATVGGAGAEATLDPRLLAFEFASTFVLRGAQVSLVSDFIAKAGGGESLCCQMIMGGGKTTVITPLLALLLADGKRLVVQCVPAALLEMSRAVVRAAFATVTRKAVYTFEYDRLTDLQATQRLRAKLSKAAATRAVVVCSPISVKAFVLKLVESLHQLSQSYAEKPKGVAGAIDAAGSALTKFGKGLLHRFGVPGSDAYVDRIKALRRETEACVAVYRVLQGSALLVDEVRS